MQLIRCTKKLQKEIGLKNADLAQQEPSPSMTGSWHANLLHIDRRKCILFVNDKTLFNFIISDVNREQIRQLDSLFSNFLQCILADEDIGEKIRDEIRLEYAEIGYANTNNRSVMGSMNDLAFNYKYQIQAKGGVHHCMLPQIIRQMNRMPMGALDYNYPIDTLRKLYGLQKSK